MSVSSQVAWQPEPEPVDAALVSYQPLLDRSLAVRGYELRFPPLDPLAARRSVASPSIPAAFEDLCADWPFNDELVIVHADSLGSQETLLASLQEREIALAFNTASATPESIRQSHARGFTIVIDNAGAATDYLDQLDFPHYMRLRPALLDAPALVAAAERCRERRILRIVSGISSQAEFEQAQQLGAELFQGTWFLDPPRKESKEIKASYMRVLEIMDLVSKHAEIREIEEVLKQDVALSVELLHYINSAGFAMRGGIRSFRQAVTMLGYDNLQRWLRMVLVTSQRKTGSSALIRTAVTRGRFVELIGEGRLSRDDLGNLIMVGMFSLLDAILGVPPKQIFARIKLSSNITEALLERKGIYAPFLKLAESVETDRFAHTAELAQTLKIGNRDLNLAQMNAHAWVKDLGL